MWADHADLLSLHYSGTGALKTDFTRTGKRTMAGIVSDVQNSAIRYLKNNFTDGYKQDSFDLLLGISNLETKLPDFDEKRPFGLISVRIYLIHTK